MGPARQRAWLCVTCVPTTVPLGSVPTGGAPQTATPRDGASPGGHKQPDSRAPAYPDHWRVQDHSSSSVRWRCQIHSHTRLPRGPHPWTAGAAAPALVPSVGVAHEWLGGRGVKGTGARAGPESPVRWAGPRNTSPTCTSPSGRPGPLCVAQQLPGPPTRPRSQAIGWAWSPAQSLPGGWAPRKPGCSRPAEGLPAASRCAPLAGNT